MKHKNGVRGNIQLSFNREVDKKYGGCGKMTIKEFFSNLFGAAFMVFVVWIYTVLFSLLLG